LAAILSIFDVSLLDRVYIWFVLFWPSE